MNTDHQRAVAYARYQALQEAEVLAVGTSAAPEISRRTTEAWQAVKQLSQSAPHLTDDPPATYDTQRASLA